MPPKKRIVVWIQNRAGRHLCLEWHDPITGQRRSKSTGTSDWNEAEDQRDELQHKLRTGQYDEPSQMPWGDFCELYDTDQLSAGTDVNRIKCLGVFRSLKKFCDPPTVGSINEQTITAYAAWLRRHGRAAATIKGHLAYLRACLRWAAAHKILSDAPRVTMPKVPKGTNRARISKASLLTDDQFKRLLEHSPHQGWRVLIALAWYCGLRRNEAVAVRGADVALDRREIAIPANKANDRAATVFIPDELAELLRAWYPKGLPPGRLAVDLPPGSEKITRAFRKIASAAEVAGNGLHGDCTLHDLRRSFGSRWAPKVPSQVLQRLMRHSAIQVTLDFYADVDAAARAAVTGGASENPRAQEKSDAVKRGAGRGAKSKKSPKSRRKS